MKMLENLRVLGGGSARAHLPRFFCSKRVRRPAFALRFSARKQFGAPSLLRVESTVCFQRKRGLPSSIKTKAGQVRVVVHWEFGCVLCALCCTVYIAAQHIVTNCTQYI
ncbi:hypothetical protein HMPREF3208_00681 [Gardnerella vaginalis]|uniref:Uncharacterized protein n=1 Tax=Gardnerella vaginalis TaxID=2702 RepID=A0A133NXG7_GARVA|nr:hypothetical protein HMPREF3208_00681 [Gardnerella vaginalis]